LTRLKNKFEKSIYRQLKRAKVRFGYETEKLAYVLARHYIPDFVIETKLGRLYIECKGYLRPEDKAKMVAVKRYHPEKDIRIIFYSRSKANIRWAERNGFQYAIEKIPTEWIT
jgi:predicted nuclease of restriction endonuclease-like RecB superfamily